MVTLGPFDVPNEKVAGAADVADEPPKVKPVEVAVVVGGLKPATAGAAVDSPPNLKLPELGAPT